MRTADVRGLNIIFIMKLEPQSLSSVGQLPVPTALNARKPTLYGAVYSAVYIVILLY